MQSRSNTVIWLEYLSWNRTCEVEIDSKVSQYSVSLYSSFFITMCMYRRHVHKYTQVRGLLSSFISATAGSHFILLCSTKLRNAYICPSHPRMQLPTHYQQHPCISHVTYQLLPFWTLNFVNIQPLHQLQVMEVEGSNAASRLLSICCRVTK